MKAKTGKYFIAACIFVLSLCCPTAQAGYIDNGDGTVTDNGTGLMWQQATAPGTYTWEQALAYCENLILNNNGLWTNGTANASGAKYSDWRLPTDKELQTIVDYGRYNPSINTTYFPNTVASSYWSSTTFASYTNFAWPVYFYNGYVYSYNKSNNFYVRAVRSGQYGSFDNLTLWSVPDTGQTTSYTSTFGEDHDYSINTPSYTKLAAGSTPLPNNATAWAMVRDDVTGLVWEEKHNMGGGTNYLDPNDADNTYTWYDNNSATNGGNAGTPGAGTDTMDFIRTMNTANYGGYSDWRMPTDKELQTIVDYDRYNPSINTTYFPNTVASNYWSSTTNADSTNLAWYVGFYDGYVDYYYKTDRNYVRAVRSGQYGSFGDLVIFKSGSGAGTVTSTDGKIDCGSDCSESYTRITGVTLTAAAASGSTFVGWSGGGCSGTGQCVLTITGNVTVTATFNVAPTTTTTSTCPAPDLTAPSGTGIIPRPAFSWQKVDGVSWYNVAVYSGAANMYAATKWFDASLVCATDNCSAKLEAALYPGQYYWWLGTYGANACGLQVQPGGKYKQFMVTGCGGPALTAPSGTVTYGTRPAHTFTSSAEWVNLQIYSSTLGAVSSQWVDASAACTMGSCSVTPVNWIMALGQNWWWVNTWSTQCGYQFQPDLNLGSYTIVP